jgi:hypothetical protein
MLAGLLTVALLASANAIELKTKPSLKEITSASHLKMTKTFRKRNTKVLPSAIATTSTTSGVAKYYVEEDASSCTGDATSYYYDGYGMCLTNYDGTTMMSSYMEVNDGSYNLTETYYSDAACATPVTSTSSLFPGSCDTAIAISSDTYTYVMSLGKFKEDSKTFGTKSFNSAADCADDDDSTVISANANIMGVCYPMYYFGVTYYYTVKSCAKVTIYTDSDCQNKLSNDDDYGDDDDDDDDDDAYSLDCVEMSGSGATPEEWDSDYCKSAASSVSVASVAMVAGSALAAFAMM